MTVSYTAEVATCRGFGCFLKLLLRWKASVYKLIWMDLLVFLTIYYALAGLYRLILDERQKIIFEKVVEFFKTNSSTSSLSFVLGFYVSVVMTRWWNQYISIPWPDSIAVFVSATIHGNDERGRLMRRTIVRYVCVCLTQVLANISPRVKKRFPTMEHYVDAGLLLENELTIFESLNSKFPKPSKHWLPIVWASSIVTRARKEGRIRDDFAVKTLIDELNKFRGSCGTLVQYDTISIPLVYTQVVTIAVYTYFLTTIIGQQKLHKGDEDVYGFYFPYFTTLEILFYMGWLKVAETLINPFGEDDDDFEVNWIVDRNLQVSYLIVDEMHHEHPELIRDQYWDEVFPTELPYTAAAEPFREEHPEPSTAGIQLSAAQQELQPSSVRIDEMVQDYQQKYGNDMNDDAISGIHFIAEGQGGKISRSASRVSRDRVAMGTGSTASNIGGSLPRINSVTNVLKRLFSKEDRPDGSAGSKTPSKLPTSGSQASLKIPGGSMKIGVIEEVDEQMTMTSQRPESRPHIMSIFPQGPPPPSAPVDVPGSNSMNGSIFSSSAPMPDLSSSTDSTDTTIVDSHTNRYRGGIRTQMSAPADRAGREEYYYSLNRNNGSSRSINSSNEGAVNEDDDEFLKLKSLREKERKERAMRKISTVSNISNRAAAELLSTSSDQNDTEALLLTEMDSDSPFKKSATPEEKSIEKQ